MCLGAEDRERDEWNVDRSYLLASSIYGLSQSQEPSLWISLTVRVSNAGSAYTCVWLWGCVCVVMHAWVMHAPELWNGLRKGMMCPEETLRNHCQAGVQEYKVRKRGAKKTENIGVFSLSKNKSMGAGEGHKSRWEVVKQHAHSHTHTHTHTHTHRHTCLHTQP